MKRKPVLWLAGYMLIVCILLGFTAAKTIGIDPYFHYHKPKTEEYSYALNNERCQNDGIVRHFDYSGLIAGSSMAENFKTSDAESLWGGTFVKVAFSGATYREISENLAAALKSNAGLKTVIRAVDMSGFALHKDAMKYDLSQYPVYLYDDDPLNDVRYLFNRDVVFARLYPMMKAKSSKDFTAGITRFDRYANWMRGQHFGKNAVVPDGITAPETDRVVHLPEATAEKIRGNITQNITAQAEQYPDVEFYCFFTPYSAVWWRNQVDKGTVYQQIEMEELVIGEMLKCPNIRLFSFNCFYDLTTNLNHYKDYAHYGEWVNTYILQCMHDGRGLITAENYEDYLEEELQFYTDYDYTQLNDQEDYDDDRSAEGLL